MLEWDVKVVLEASAISVGTESYVLGTHSKQNGVYISGYAPIARIVEVGAKAAAAGYQVGQRISYFAPQPAKGMRQCCGGHQGMGLVNVDPASRDLLGSDCYVVKVPDGLTSERAAFAGISAVSCQGVSLARPNVGEKALVIGQGLIGQFAAAHLHLRGAEVMVVDVYDKRLAIAKAWGADHAINTRDKDLARAVREIWPRGADIIADSTGNYQAIEASVDAMKGRDGKYVLLAWCKGPFNLPRFHNRIFEVYLPWTLQGFRVLNSFRLAKSGALNIDAMITHRFRYTDAPKAYDMLYAAPQDYCGIVFDWRGQEKE
jgi:2-desacetyl-2-hydroxyethyl bacteriochlorophyllide A dehydrogenase